MFEVRIKQILDGEHALIEQAADAEDKLLAKAFLGGQALIDYAREQLKGTTVSISFDSHEVERAKPNEQ